MNSINDLYIIHAYSHTCTHVPTLSESYTYISYHGRITVFKGKKNRKKDYIRHLAERYEYSWCYSNYT